jgi:hypothetical protein
MIWFGRPSHDFPSRGGLSSFTRPRRSCHRVTFRPDFVAHPHPLTRVARATLCCASPPRAPSHELASPVVAALHPPAAATVKVRATDELRTSDLRALRGIELRAGVELHDDELHSSKQRGIIALCAKSAWCKRMFLLFYISWRYVARVLYVCCKSRL